MEVSTEMPVDMLREVEAEDPIDYADLPCEKQELRRFIVSGLVERHHAVETGVSVSDVHALYLLSTAKPVLENTVLRAHLFLLRGHQRDMDTFLAPFTRRRRHG